MSQQDAGAAPPPADRARRTGAALEAHYRFLLWLVPAVERFPRSQKFLLGDRIQYTGHGGRVNHRLRLFALPVVERHCRKRSCSRQDSDLPAPYGRTTITLPVFALR